MNWPIPKGWNWELLGNHIAEVSTSIGSLQPEQAKAFEKLRGVSNREGIIDPPFDRVRLIKDPRRYVILEVGSFAYNPMRINVGSIGLIRSESQRGKISPDYVIFKTRPTLLPELLFRWIKSPLGSEMINRSTSGAVRQRLYFQDLAKLHFPVPPIPEQRRIVALLDQAENLRSLRQQADRRTADLIPALFHEMFGDPIRKPMWPVCRVDEAGQVQLGRQRAPKYQSGDFTIPYIRVANVFEDRIDVSDLLSMDFDRSDFPKYRLHRGDILLNEGQSTELVGRPAMWQNEVADCCFQNTLIRFKANRSVVDPAFALALFLFYFRNGEFAKLSSKTSSVAHLGAARFAAMSFPLPPLPLQKQFAAAVADIRAMRAHQAAAKKRLDDLFHSLLHRAFRGEL